MRTNITKPPCFRFVGNKTLQRLNDPEILYTYRHPREYGLENDRRLLVNCVAFQKYLFHSKGLFHLKILLYELNRCRKN